MNHIILVYENTNTSYYKNFLYEVKVSYNTEKELNKLIEEYCRKGYSVTRKYSILPEWIKDNLRLYGNCLFLNSKGNYVIRKDQKK